MKFWDSSAILKLCIQEERDSGKVKSIAHSDPALVVWWATHTECLSGILRRARQKELGLQSESEAKRKLSELKRLWHEIGPGEELRTLAERLLHVHPLRAGDAFQLAAALSWCGTPTGAGFVTLDRRLSDAARAEGFTVLPEPDAPPTAVPADAGGN